MNEQKPIPIKIVWAALCTLPFIFLFLLKTQEFTQTSQGVNQKVFTIVSIAIGIIAMMLPKFMLQHHTRDRKFENFKQKVPVYFVPMVIRMSLCESIAIFGYLVANAQQEISAYYPFMIPALALMLFSFPTNAKIENFRI